MHRVWKQTNKRYKMEPEDSSVRAHTSMKAMGSASNAHTVGACGREAVNRDTAPIHAPIPMYTPPGSTSIAATEEQ